MAVGDGSGNVELWDVTKSKQLRTMRGHTDRVPVLGWNAHILASGCRNGQVRLLVLLSTVNRLSLELNAFQFRLIS